MPIGSVLAWLSLLARTKQAVEDRRFLAYCRGEKVREVGWYIHRDILFGIDHLRWWTRHQGIGDATISVGGPIPRFHLRPSDLRANVSFAHSLGQESEGREWC